MRDIKIIMSDVDGTILNSEGRVSPRTIEAIKAAKAQGLIFGLATGRDIESTEFLFKGWGIEGLVDVFVGENGAHIKDYRLGIDEKAPPLEKETVRAIINHYSDLPITFMVVINSKFCLMNAKEADSFIHKIGNVKRTFVTAEEIINSDIRKLNLFFRSELTTKIYERYATLNMPNIVGVQTGDTFFEFFDAKYSKSNGLKKVIEMDGLTLNNLLVFGDADNDVSMLADSKIGVVMANGTPLAKSVANYVTEDNDHDGIAIFLEKHILKKQKKT